MFKNKKNFFILSLLAIGYITFSNYAININFINNNGTNNVFIRFLIGLRVVGELLVCKLFCFITSIAIGSYFSHWLLIICFLLLMALCIRNIYLFLKNRKSIPCLSIIIVYYFISLLFFSNYLKIDIDWQTQAEEISLKQEKRQFGIFTNFIKYINQDEGTMFFYSTGKNDENLFFKQSARLKYNKCFAVKNITSVKSYNLTEIENCYSKMDQPNINPWLESVPADFTCENDQSKSGIVWAENKIACTALFYKNKLIYKQDTANQILSITVDDRQEFALIEIGHGFYNPETVYLVNLK